MLHQIAPEQLSGNVFEKIGKQWMLITAGTPAHCNTMTASWGGLGVLWGSPVSTIYVRPNRYTMEFLTQEKFYTLSFLPEQYRPALNYCGSHSGRAGDKFAAAGLTKAASACGAAYAAESELVLVCEKAYWQDMDPAHFLLPDTDSKWYPQHDYHRMFIGRIVEAYTR